MIFSSVSVSTIPLNKRNMVTKIFSSIGIVNGARGYVESFEYVQISEGSTKLKRIWIVFPSPGTGSHLREDSKGKGISNANPLAVPISEIKATFEIPRIKIKVSRSQFPMVLCFCMTSYKSQGQTLDATILDYKDAFSKHGTFYVGVTRVRSINGLFIRNFSRSQIKCREDVKTELKQLKRNRNYTFFKTYLNIKIWKSTDDLKFGYLNINGLVHNLRNLEKDINLSHLNYICLAETKLSADVSNDKINEQLGKSSKMIFF